MGKEMIHYKWSSSEPWHVRFLQANGLKEKDIPRAEK